MPLEISVRQIAEGVHLIEPDGEFEVYTASQVKEALEALTAEGGCRLCLSLEKVTFLDSKGIGVIVAGTKLARNAGGDLAVICTSERFARHFRILKLEDFFTIVGSEDEAVERLGDLGGGNEPN